MKERNNKFKNFIKTHRVRLVLCGVLSMSLFVTPALTQAQYKWTLNGYNILQAKEFYFDGNYMHDVSNNTYYQTTGWDGTEFKLPTIEIQNYTNALLANKQGEDIYYKFYWTIKTCDANGHEIEDENQKYTLSDSGEHTGNGLETNPIIGKIEGTGEPNKNTYTLTVNPGNGEILPTGSYVDIVLTAENVADDKGTPSQSFYKKIQCTFRYIISQSNDFIRQFDLHDEENSKDVTLSIGTGVTPSMMDMTQSMIVWWRTDALDINAFNMLFSEMSSQDGYYYTENHNGHTYQILKISGLGSNAHRSLGFYKLNYNDKTQNSHWFTTDDMGNLVGNGVKPESATADQIIGYYMIENKTESGTQ